MQNSVVIGWIYFKPEHSRFWLNFEFDRNPISGLLHMVRNLISKDFKIPSNLYFEWKDILCSNSCMSVSLKYTLKLRILWLENPDLGRLWHPKNLIFHYPRPVLAFGYCRCLHLCVCPCVCRSVCQSLACPRDNSWPVQARITKFWSKMQMTLVKVPIVLGGQLTLTFKVKFNFKFRIYPILSLSAP